MRQEGCLASETEAFLRWDGRQGDVLCRHHGDLALSVLCIFGASCTAGERLCADGAREKAKLLRRAADLPLKALPLRNRFVVVYAAVHAPAGETFLAAAAIQITAADVEADLLLHGDGVQSFVADGGKAPHALEPPIARSLSVHEVTDRSAVLRALYGERQRDRARLCQGLDGIGINKAQAAIKEAHEVVILMRRIPKCSNLDEARGKDAAQYGAAEAVLCRGHDGCMSRCGEDHRCFCSDTNLHHLHQRLPPFRP